MNDVIRATTVREWTIRARANSKTRLSVAPDEDTDKLEDSLFSATRIEVYWVARIYSERQRTVMRANAKSTAVLEDSDSGGTRMG